MNIKFQHKDLGITDSVYAVIKNVSISSQNEGLEKLKQEVLKKVLATPAEEYENSIFNGKE